MKLFLTATISVIASMGAAAIAQDPSASSSEVGSDLIQSDAEALRADAAIYSEMYGVNQNEAERRIKLMVSAQEIANLEEQEAGEDLVSSYFEHDGEFRLVIEKRGQGQTRRVTRNVGVRGRPSERLEMPVEYRSSNRPTRVTLRKIFRERNNMIDRTFPEPHVVSYDEREGVLTLSFDNGVALENAARRQARLENAIGVTVRLLQGSPETETGMRGGLQPYRLNEGGGSYITNCTLGFAAQGPGPAYREGYITAGHCADNLYWKESDTAQPIALTSIDRQTSRGDWQFTWGAPVERLFKADTGTFRRATGRRTLSTTCEKTGSSSVSDSAILVTPDNSYCDGATNGTFVCWFPGHYGKTISGIHGLHTVGHTAVGQQCGEVNAKAVKLQECGPTDNLVCDYAWVEVIPKSGQSTFVAWQGDSGSPIFAWNTAFGIMTNSGYYGSYGQQYRVDDATGRTTHMWYTPIDEIYREGYSLLY